MQDRAAGVQGRGRSTEQGGREQDRESVVQGRGQASKTGWQGCRPGRQGCRLPVRQEQGCTHRTPLFCLYAHYGREGCERCLCQLLYKADKDGRAGEEGQKGVGRG